MDRKWKKWKRAEKVEKLKVVTGWSGMLLRPKGRICSWSFQRHAEIRREAMRRWSCGSGMGVSSERDSGGEYGEKELKRRVQSGVGRNFESWYEENGEWMKV
jgi:hypothetical protein